MFDVFYCPVPLTVTDVPVTDHHGCATRKFSDALWYKFLGNWFLVHLTNNTFILDFKLLQEKFHFLQKPQENATSWCIMVVASLLLNISLIKWWNIAGQKVTRIKYLHNASQVTNTPSGPLVNLSVLCLLTSQTLQKIAFSYGPCWKCQFFSEIFVIYNSNLTPKDTTKCLCFTFIEVWYLHSTKTDKLVQFEWHYVPPSVTWNPQTSINCLTGSSIYYKPSMGGWLFSHWPQDWHS